MANNKYKASHGTQDSCLICTIMGRTMAFTHNSTTNRIEEDKGGGQVGERKTSPHSH